MALIHACRPHGCSQVWQLLLYDTLQALTYNELQITLCVVGLNACHVPCPVLQEAAAEAEARVKEAEAAAQASPVDAVTAARVKWRQRAASGRQQAALAAAAVELERRKEREAALKQQVCAYFRRTGKAGRGGAGGRGAQGLGERGKVEGCGMGGEGS